MNLLALIVIHLCWNLNDTVLHYNIYLYIHVNMCILGSLIEGFICNGSNNCLVIDNRWKRSSFFPIAIRNLLGTCRTKSSMLRICRRATLRIFIYTIIMLLSMMYATISTIHQYGFGSMRIKLHSSCKEDSVTYTTNWKIWQQSS